MYELKSGKLFTSKSIGTGTSSHEKRTYRAAVLQRFRNTALEAAGSTETSDSLLADIRQIFSWQYTEATLVLSGLRLTHRGVIVPCVFASMTLRDGNQPISVCTEGLRWPEHKANFVIVRGSKDTSIPPNQLHIFTKI